MKTMSVRTHAAYVVVIILLLISLIDQSATPSQNISNSNDFGSIFLQDSQNWTQVDLMQCGENKMNLSSAAEVVVGEGEKYGDVQTALDAGYSCVYLKKERFNVTKPITPAKEDIYIIGNSAEIFATEPMSAIIDIRGIRYAHLDGLVINGNGLATKCVDASRGPNQVPVHQIRNCKIWGATFANVDFTGCEDSLVFNCWIDGRIRNDTPDVVTQYGVKIGEFGEGYRTGGQINLIHCLIGFQGKADVFAKNIAELKLANCLLCSKTQWSQEFTAHIIIEGGEGENAIQPTLELSNCWVENGPDGNVPNVLIRTKMISKLLIVGGMFYTDYSSNVYSNLTPCAETVTLVGALFEHNLECEDYNIVAPARELVSIGNTYNSHSIDKTNVTRYLIFDRDSTCVETNG